MLRRNASFLVGISTLTAMAFQVVMAPIGSAQCADPRGNSYCTNNGQVTFGTPASQSQTPSQPCADPRGNACCTNGGLVNVQNPNPPTNVNVQNPNAGDSGAQNPNAQIGRAH